MPQGAKVESLDAIKRFRAALIKFREIGNTALSSSESDIDHNIDWLEREQIVYWENQRRKRHDDVIRCEEAVREKQLYKNFDGTSKSVVDEQKALSAARRRREDAEQKIVAVKRAIQLLTREAQLYKGRMQKLASAFDTEIPKAVGQLDSMLNDLDAYLSIQTEGAGIELKQAAEQLTRMTSSKKVGHEQLRDRTPADEIRKSAAKISFAANDPFFGIWGIGMTADWQLAAVTRLQLDRRPSDPEQRIIIERKVWEHSYVYLERREPLGEGDSGWFMGKADLTKTPVEPIEYDAIRVGDAIAARPDFADLLSLPVGFLIVFDESGLAAMLDHEGHDVWAMALMAQSVEKES